MRKRIWNLLFLVGFMCLVYNTSITITIRWRETDGSPKESCMSSMAERFDHDPGEPPRVPKRGPPSQPLLVLTLSSLARSGSTLMSQFLATLQGAVLFFEPMWIKEHTECAGNATCVERYIRSIFTCTFSEDFEEWFRGKGIFFNRFNQAVRDCGRPGNRTKKECKDSLDIRGMCEQAPVRAMKIIRTRLAYLEPMMQDPLINFKVIYLTRDPRGSLNSIRKYHWKKDPLLHCSHLENDQLACARLSKKYPDRVMHLKHEDFCLDPMGKASQIMTFLYGDPTLPDTLKTFLVNHMAWSQRYIKRCPNTCLKHDLRFFIDYLYVSEQFSAST
ncbi:carbohydrate sulfotransferase 5-like [Penaeus japonicus]|uniref:carbohydrate sulfotransferase 5-like n=1 Tax=Penaeus japonicus TaxID=27405 RepID=UPI001C70F6E0|nr:carbohydrate sulfotransferase 5-like [Penaeus japonicus]